MLGLVSCSSPKVVGKIEHRDATVALAGVRDG